MFKEVSTTVRSRPNFTGPFFSWRVTYYTNREKGTCDAFVVFSSGKRQKVHRFLWLKLLWDELTKDEFELFLSMPETLKNEKIVGFLQARLEIPKTVLRDRILKFESFFNENSSCRKSYNGLMRLRIDLQRGSYKLRKTPKFSGYVRNISSLNRGGRRGAVFTDPIVDLPHEIDQETDWYTILTVGEVLFPPKR